jgi:hypothetical protein
MLGNNRDVQALHFAPEGGPSNAELPGHLRYLTLIGPAIVTIAVTRLPCHFCAGSGSRRR